MNQPITFTIGDVQGTILAIAALITALGVIANSICKIYEHFKRPDREQDTEISIIKGKLDEYDKKIKEIDRRLDRGADHFGSIDEGNRVTQRAILALLSHGIDGNSIEPMKKSKEELENFLIEK